MTPEMEFAEALKNKNKEVADSLIEQNLIGNPDLLLKYALMFNQRLPQSVEFIVLVNPYYAWEYISKAVKDRVPEAEEIIKQDPYIYQLYINFLKKIGKYDEFMEDQGSDQKQDQIEDERKIEISDLLKNPEKLNDFFSKAVDRGNKELADLLLPHVLPILYYEYVDKLGERVPIKFESKLFDSTFSAPEKYLEYVIEKGKYNSFLKDWGDTYINEIVKVIANFFSYNPLIEHLVRTNKEWVDQVILPLFNYDFDRTSREWGVLLVVLLSTYDYKLPSRILSKLSREDLEAVKEYLDDYEQILIDREGDSYVEDSYNAINEAYKYLRKNLRR